ncbi:MAG: tetratricopeptide repeat protein, partial [Candidatus Levyibacteriota bacterium]
TYTLQTKAISIFPYNSDYYRIFSQTNISLANSLFALQPKGSSPSAQVQQTAFALVQQAISTARNATTLSPDLVANWQNLASLYRTLIGFGQNAENFAISSMQQAIAVDPTNPQEYINLGGIYYQLGQYDNAIHQFETAITLKQDLANAYYNLGHAYEQKGDLQNALIQYKNVKILVVNDKANTTRIDQEIKIIEGKIGEQNTNQKTIPQAVTPKQPAAQSQPLNINGQESQQAGQAATPTITQENVNPTAPQVPVSPSPTNPTP